MRIAMFGGIGNCNFKMKSLGQVIKLEGIVHTRLCLNFALFWYIS